MQVHASFPLEERVGISWLCRDPSKILFPLCLICLTLVPIFTSKHKSTELTETEKILAKTAFVWVTHRIKEGWGYRFGGYMMRNKASNDTTVSATTLQIVLLSRHTQACTVHRSVWNWIAHSFTTTVVPVLSGNKFSHCCCCHHSHWKEVIRSLFHHFTSFWVRVIWMAQSRSCVQGAKSSESKHWPFSTSDWR